MLFGSPPAINTRSRIDSRPTKPTVIPSKAEGPAVAPPALNQPSTPKKLEAEKQSLLNLKKDAAADHPHPTHSAAS
jgi:hypothetical protein